MAPSPPPVPAPKPPDPPRDGAYAPPTAEVALAPQIPTAVQSSGVRSYVTVAAAPRPALFSSVEVAASSATRPQLKPRFPSITLPSRQVGMKEGKPAISFTASEIAACEKLYEHSIVAKFTVGRPNLAEIQRTFRDNWSIVGRASLSDIWDSRHVLIIFDSEEDVRVALSSSLNKVGHAFFRLFRWSPDYNPKRESTVTTIWVRLPNLPLSLYESSFIKAIISTIGYFIDVDDRTKACKSLKFARACVELDVTKPIPEAVWINLPDNRSYWQPIEIESKLGYCSKCKVHGHSFDICRKRKTPTTNMGKKDIGKDLPNSLPKDPLEKETNPQHVCGPQTPTDPGVVGEVDIVESVSLEKETCVPMADESKAMVVYEGVVDDMRENPPPSTVEEGQSSQVGKSMESLAPAPAGPRTLQEYLPFIMPYLEADGIVEVPEILDEAFLEKASRAARMYRNNEPIPTVAHGEASPPLSEWIPAKKKKGKKGAHSVNESALRRSSRDRQSTTVKNSDFIYRAVG